MPEFIPNPYWTALATEQRAIALGSGPALRFPADIIPFAGLREPTPEAMQSLHDLLAPDESIFVTGETLAAFPGLTVRGAFPGWQMHHAGALPPAPSANREAGEQAIEDLTAANAAEMVALTDVAFPGYFRARTYVLGAYIGIRSPDGQLIAMAGERLALPGLREISAVCTHPAHTGHGYASRLIRRLLHMHRDAGIASFLHVSGSNHRAIALYERLGFTTSGRIVWNHLQRERTSSHAAAATEKIESSKVAIE